MKKLFNLAKKTTAALMAGLFLSMPVSGIAAASTLFPENNNAIGHNISTISSFSDDYQSYGRGRYWCKRHHRYHNHRHDHDRDWRDHDKDDNGNAITGFIVGAVVGAIVAKNT